MCFRFQCQHALTECVALIGQLLVIDQNAVLFHGEKHLRGREFQIAVGAFQPRFAGQSGQESFGNA